MANINARVFGSPIPKKVQRKLEARQEAASKPIDPNTTLTETMTYKDALNNEFKGEADLSSRTPFARMWTAVQMREKVNYAENEEYIQLDFDYDGTNVGEGLDNRKLALDIAKRARDGSYDLDGIGKPDPKLGAYYPRSYVYHDAENTGKYFIRQLKSTSVAIEGWEKKIYSLTANNISTLPHSSISGQQTQTEKDYNRVFPNEHQVTDDNNKFMKSPAGITSVTSETEGSLGVIKKTIINFKVNNFADYEEIYMRYFMRPGAQVFVDFGWSNVELYDPEKLITDLDYSEMHLQRLLFDKRSGIVAKYQGDLETLIGIVTDYRSTVNPDGAVECSITLTSKNSALLNGAVTDDKIRRISFLLEHQIFFESLYNFSSPTEKTMLKKSIPARGSGIEDITSFKEAIIAASKVQLMDKDSYVPKSAVALGSGTFTAQQSEDKSSNYITWGLIEDRIINGEFGFGADLEDLTNESLANKSSFQTTLDSSETYVRWDKQLLKRQTFMGYAGETPPMVLYPDNWGMVENGYPKTYSLVNKKRPDYGELIEQAIEELNIVPTTDKHVDTTEAEIIERSERTINSAFETRDKSADEEVNERSSKGQVADWRNPSATTTNDTLEPDGPYHDPKYDPIDTQVSQGELSPDTIATVDQIASRDWDRFYKILSTLTTADPMSQIDKMADHIKYNVLYGKSKKINKGTIDEKMVWCGVCDREILHDIYGDRLIISGVDHGWDWNIFTGEHHTGHFWSYAEFDDSHRAVTTIPKPAGEKEGCYTCPDCHIWTWDEDKYIKRTVGGNNVCDDEEFDQWDVIHSGNRAPDHSPFTGDGSAGDAEPPHGSFDQRKIGQNFWAQAHLMWQNDMIVKLNTTDIGLPEKNYDFVKDYWVNHTHILEPLGEPLSQEIKECLINDEPRVIGLCMNWGITKFVEPFSGQYPYTTLENLGMVFGNWRTSLLEALDFENLIGMTVADILEAVPPTVVGKQSQEPKGNNDLINNAIDWTYIDKYHQRIPLRELFVNVSDIKDAFSQPDTTTEESINFLLKKINENTAGIFDLRLVSAPGDDTSLTVIDNNYLGVNKNTTKDVRDSFDKLFMFDVTGKNSIVQGYNLELAIPSGNIASMLAIQGISDTNQMYNLSSNDDSNLAFTQLIGNKGSKYVTYLPQLSAYRAARNQSEKAISAGLFDTFRDFVKLNDFTISPQYSSFDGLDLKTIQEEYGGEEAQTTGKIYSPEKQSVDPKLSWQKGIAKYNENISQANKDLHTALGDVVVDNFGSYFTDNALTDYLNSVGPRGRATPFNMFTLTLTCYGISSLQPGDIFRVNYLPKMYIENIYFQVIKVKHSINPAGGWLTTLETQFRMRPENKNLNNFTKIPSNIFLDPETFASSVRSSSPSDNQGHLNQFQILASGGGSYLQKLKDYGNDVVDDYDKNDKSWIGLYQDGGKTVAERAQRINKLVPFIENVKPYTAPWINHPLSQVSHAFEFRCFKDILNKDLGISGQPSNGIYTSEDDFHNFHIPGSTMVYPIAPPCHDQHNGYHQHMIEAFRAGALQKKGMYFGYKDTGPISMGGSTKYDGYLAGSSTKAGKFKDWKPIFPSNNPALTLTVKPKNYYQNWMMNNEMGDLSDSQLGFVGYRVITQGYTNRHMLEPGYHSMYYSPVDENGNDKQLLKGFYDPNIYKGVRAVYGGDSWSDANYDPDWTSRRISQGDLLNVSGLKERYNDGYKTYFQEEIDGRRQDTHFSGWIQNDGTGFSNSEAIRTGVPGDDHLEGTEGDIGIAKVVASQTWPDMSSIMPHIEGLNWHKTDKTDGKSSTSVGSMPVIHAHPCMTTVRPSIESNQRPTFYPAAFGNYHYTQTHYRPGLNRDRFKKGYGGGIRPSNIDCTRVSDDMYTAASFSDGWLTSADVHEEAHNGKTHFGPTNFYAGYKRDSWGHGMWQNAFALNLARGGVASNEWGGASAMIDNDFVSWQGRMNHETGFLQSSGVDRNNSNQDMGTNGHPAWRFVNGHLWFHRFQKGQDYVMVFNKANAQSHYICVLKEALENDLNGIQTALAKINTSSKSGIIITGYAPKDGQPDSGPRSEYTQNQIQEYSSDMSIPEQQTGQTGPLVLGNYNFLAQDWYANNIQDPSPNYRNPGFGTINYTGRMTNPNGLNGKSRDYTGNYGEDWVNVSWLGITR